MSFARPIRKNQPPRQPAMLPIEDGGVIRIAYDWPCAFCGRYLSPYDVILDGGNIEIICSAGCHRTLAKIEFPK
jgi:hypothetical protein